MAHRLNTTAFEWAAATFSALLATALLVVPHYFNFLTSPLLIRALPLLSLVMLASACSLLLSLVYLLPRVVWTSTRLVTGLTLLLLAAGFEFSGSLLYGTSIILIGLGLWWSAARRTRPDGLDLLALALGTASLFSGALLLLDSLMGWMTANSISELTQLQRAFFGMLQLWSGLLLILASVRRGAARSDQPALQGISGAARLLWAAVWAGFLVVAVRPEYFWAPLLYTSVFGGALLLTPYFQQGTARVQPSGLRTRLALVFALATSLPLIITVAVVNERAEEQALLEARFEIESQSSIFGEEISQYVQLHRSALGILAAQDGLLDMPAAQRQALLERYKGAFPNATSFTIYDQNAMPAASTNPEILGVSLAGYPTFEDARRTLQPSFDLLVSPVLREPIVAFGAPILGPDGQFRGMAGSGLLIGGLAERINRHGQQTGTAYYLVDGRARAVIQPAGQDVQPLADLSDQPAVQAYLQSEPESGSIVLPLSHDLLAYQRIPELGMGLLGVQKDETALANHLAARELALLILMFFFAAVTLASFQLSGRMVSKLEHLAYAADQLAAGQYDASLPHSTVEEIQHVSDSFATMRANLLRLRQAEAEHTAQLEAARSELELRVERRTAELASTARRLQTVLQALPVGIWISDASGRIIEKNDISDQIWGRSPQVNSISDFGQYLGWWPDSGEQVAIEEWAMARALLEGEVVLGERVDIQRFDGQRAAIINSAAPIKDENGQISGAVTVEQDITHQRELEQRASAAAEEAGRLLGELEAVFNALTDSVVVYNSEGMILRANPRSLEMYGIELVGVKRDDSLEQMALQLPDGRPFDHRQLPSAQVLRGEKVVKQRLRVTNPRGQTFVVLASTAPIYVGDELLGAVAIWHDITELQQAIDTEQVLLSENRQQRELLERLVSEAPVAIAFVQGPEHRYSLVNRAYEHVARGKGTLVGRTLAEVWPEIAWKLLPLLDHTLQTGEASHQSDESYFILRNGNLEEEIFSITLTPILNASGQVEGVMMLVAENTDEVLARREAEIERARLRTLFQYAPEGIVLVDARGNILLTNPAYELLLSDPVIHGEAFASHPGLDMRSEHGEPLQPADFPLVRSVQGETVTNQEVEIRQPDGQCRSLLISSAPVRDEQGEISGAVGIFQDITLRKEMEDTLADYARQLERSNKDLEDFAFIASHDLQEPLRKIQAFGSMLEKDHGPQLDDTARDYIQRMTGASVRMKTMIDDLLTYSRLTTRAQSFTLVDLNQTLHEVLSDLELRLRETGGQVQADALPVIVGDSSQIRQLLLNLVGNALKFHKRGQAPQVRISARRVDHPSLGQDGELSAEQIELIVEDDGIGFDEKHIDLIFQPFQRLHGRGQYEGSGIGLAICRKIVERHGGSISARSAPGKGSVFVVCLPVEQESAEPARPARM